MVYSSEMDSLEITKTLEWLAVYVRVADLHSHSHSHCFARHYYFEVYNYISRYHRYTYMAYLFFENTREVVVPFVQPVHYYPVVRAAAYSAPASPPGQVVAYYSRGLSSNPASYYLIYHCNSQDLSIYF